VSRELQQMRAEGNALYAAVNEAGSELVWVTDRFSSNLESLSFAGN